MGKTANGNGTKLLWALAATLIVAGSLAVVSQGKVIASHDATIVGMQETLRRIETKLDEALSRQP
jgi:hypothetical protein